MIRRRSTGPRASLRHTAVFAATLAIAAAVAAGCTAGTPAMAPWSAASPSVGPAVSPAAPSVAPVSPGVVASPTASPGVSGPTPSPSASAAAGEVVLIAVGDVGRCDATGDDETGALAASLPGTVAILGDTAYDSGSAPELERCFGESWGAVEDRIRYAAMGNHDIKTDDGAPLKAYLGDAVSRDGRTWFSDDLGAWHVVVLDSNCGLRRRGLQQEFGPGPLAARGPRGERCPVHRRPVAPPPVQQRVPREQRQRGSLLGCAPRGGRRAGPQRP